MKVAVIGGGAAGFFAAISCKQHHSDALVSILEGSTKILSKVKISGGGRCNVTHACFHNNQLIKFYPRGEKFLKKSFEQFSTKDTVAWFENHGVKLKEEEDHRMFPSSNDSQTIIDCLLEEIEKLGIDLQTGIYIERIEKEDHLFRLTTNQGLINFDRVIIAAGGQSKIQGFDFLKPTGHRIVDPVPSLFTFNLPNESIKELMGVVAPAVKIKIKGTSLQSNGPLLITHWGFSGPAVLKLSSRGARVLHKMNYNFEVLVNWVDGKKEEQVRSVIEQEIKLHGERNAGNKNPFQIPLRLWKFLLLKSEVSPNLAWKDQKKKNLNKLINHLVNDDYQSKGKTTFKEEFVTCGGVSLGEVDPHTMQSRQCAGLYFAGEILDIDAVTGGFNFQAAWTTGFIAGKLQ